jgi:hypothetical protein
VHGLITRWSTVLAAAFLLAGCVGYGPYHTPQGPLPSLEGGRLPPPPPVTRQCDSAPTCIVYVEFDDFGNPLNRAQLDSALATAEGAFEESATVIVYVHGWHNSADPRVRDGELQMFKSLIATAPRMRARAGRILGIYVGWRGESIPVRGAGEHPGTQGATKAITWIPSQLTMWGRKAAAHRVGQAGAVVELFIRLAEMRRRSPESRLLVHGLSFGTAVIHSAVSTLLVQQILQDAERSSGKCDARQSAKGESLVPWADLVLLINPAFEAMRLRPHLDIARARTYPCALPPRLVVLTTEADWATGQAFPLGRYFSTLLDRYADGQSVAQNKTAVGHYIPYITHQLEEVSLETCLGREGTRVQTRLDPGVKHWCASPKKDQFPEARPVLLTRCDPSADAGTTGCASVAPGHFIERGDPAQGFVPSRMPILNIRTTEAVMDSHTDLDNESLRNFVFRLMETAIADPGSLPFNVPARETE